VEHRDDSGKNMTGQTCPLHDSQKKHNVYRKAQNAIDKAPYENTDSARRQTPQGIRVLMLFGLIFQRWSPTNREFEIVQKCLESHENPGVPKSDIQKLKKLISINFPPAAEPEATIRSIEEIETNGVVSVKKLLNILTIFIKTDLLPFHPELVAFQMELFCRESWYVQNHNQNYYNSGSSKGRPRKLNHDAIRSEYITLITENPKNKQEIKSMLANKYKCSERTIQNIIKECILNPCPYTHKSTDYLLKSTH